MKNIKRFSILAAVLVLSLGILAACGGGGGDSADKTIKVAASPTPHAEILNSISEALAADGWTLEVVEFDDYVQPNVATTDGDVDANYFQHVPYLDQYNSENGTDLVAVGNVHYEAMGAYKGQKDSFDALADGDKIGVPNDVTNEARALQLLAANGVITLKDGVGLEATKLDIVDNPKNIEIVELEAATIPASLPDLALGVINANYALGAGLTTDDAVAYEAADSEAAETYVNVIVVNAGNENSEKTQALVKAIQTDAVKDFILEKYNGAVQPKF
ncbi:MAG: MetQ/NlpA family ABC transporter substrate-binding protein [Mogibacterium sp.]|nr:MetQ/NlpA family ABC transporter substrate-binding protein [Mogibacterium sp.]MBQ6500000.1 MetQ/NlpA family ABC transporter substrate-binding protein [Mogibacterium sp.]